MSAALLSVRGLTRAFGGLLAINQVDLDVFPGEIVGLIGPNGAGKTTLFNLLCGGLAPTWGRVMFDGQDCTGWPAYRMARAGALRTFQITSLFPEVSVAENIRIASHRTCASGWVDSLFLRERFRSEERTLDERVETILSFVGLQHRRALQAKVLPYGDQRKLEIAIAMAGNPRLMLLDEPAAGMNPDEGEKLVQMMRRIRDSGVTVVLVEHHMRVVLNVCDRVVVLDHGVKIAEGVPAEVVNDPEVIRVYLGREKVRA